MLIQLYAVYFPFFIYLALNVGLVCYSFQRVWLKALYLISFMVLFSGYFPFGSHSFAYMAFFTLASIVCIVKEQAFFLVPFVLMNLFLSAPASYWAMSSIESADFVTVEIEEGLPMLLYPVRNLLDDLAGLSWIFLLYVASPWFILKGIRVWRRKGPRAKETMKSHRKRKTLCQVTGCGVLFLRTDSDETHFSDRFDNRGTRRIKGKGKAEPSLSYHCFRLLLKGYAYI